MWSATKYCQRCVLKQAPFQPVLLNHIYNIINKYELTVNAKQGEMGTLDDF